jgi:hypothetical protein
VPRLWRSRLVPNQDATILQAAIDLAAGGALGLGYRVDIVK